MHRRAVLLLALAACETPAPEAEPAKAHWVYAPAPTAWPLGTASTRIGRSQAPQPLVSLGIAGEPTTPLRLATPWTVPGDGPARAVVYGADGGKPAIELIEVDAGRVVWRDTESCTGPVVGVTAETIVCTDGTRTRGVSLDRKTTWTSDAAFVAITDDRVVVTSGPEVTVLDAGSGDELARVTLPAGVLPESVLASCGDAGRELFAVGGDGRLVRVVENKIAWGVPIGQATELDACEGGTVIVETPGVTGTALVAIARVPGVVTGRIDGVRGTWKARGGDGVEVATADGVRVWTRDLTTSVATDLPPLGELLASYRDARLVRASASTAVVLDARGVRAYVALTAMGAVLGDRAILAASWVGSPAETVRRVALPARYRRVLRVPTPIAGVALPAELRDLPALTTLDLSKAITRTDATAQALGPIALDDGIVYATTLDAAGRAGIVGFDLAKRETVGARADGCGVGVVRGLGIAHDVVACGTQADEGASVTATRRDGSAAWTYATPALDGVLAAGADVVVLAADRAIVLDASTGAERAHLASDDGGPVRAALLELDPHTTVIVVAERGRVVARLPRAGMVPAWSVAVDGTVRALLPSGDGVVVELEDGDAYRLDARTGAVVALPGLGLTWVPSSDLVAGTTAGGDIPGVALPLPPAPRGPVRRTRQGRRLPPPPPPEEADRPKMWTPIAPPPALGPSLQVTLYDLGGGVRARNDYGVLSGALAAHRGPAGSPLVITHGDLVAIVLDPRTGDPLRRVALPSGTGSGAVFSTVIDGAPVAGVVLAQPLRIVVF